ncbi:restriction endonuclease subunit S [Corynebacterium urealyticum]|uniref:restriction endonuclease subunit S n=1 Tax=Corynebacterium urealyticum TaxID=43771 RepID=UPI001910D698|nr:restriction endonuclease subunit S [Corynebacterium urealyticum]QQE50650.1 restriction endonuclease subunit S [Corynebacterium urealyticum]
MAKHNTPALRFDGFDGEWDHRELNQIGVKSTATNAGAALTETFTNSAQYGIISQLEYFDNAVSNPANISKYSVVEPDDFVYNPRISVTAPFGPINRNRLSRSGAMSPLYLVFKVFGVDHGFLEQFFKTDLWHDFMRLNGDVGARHDRFSIGDAKFMGMQIPTPLLEEQRAIGELFANLDALIEQHRAKHVNLQQTRTALLQRMFPQDGADEPELRLGGFSGAWEARPLKNLGSSYGGLTGKTKEDFGHGDARYITYLDVFERALITDASRLGATDIDNRQNEVKTCDVLFTVSSEVPEEVGMSAVWLGQGRNIYLNSFCFGFRPTAELDSKFLAYVLRSPDFRKKMTLLAQGISRFNISKTRAMELEISFPTLEEQRAIGEVFADLDALIAAEASYITQLTQAKTALLQRMFV